MNSKALFNDLVKTITVDESLQEIQSITYIILEHTLGISRTDVFAEKEITVTTAIRSAIKDAVIRINAHEPVQYIFGRTEFFGRTFSVNPGVLIPRPETEELVLLVTDHFKERNISAPRILDIGAGSGCISITLALEIPQATVFATDVSKEALVTAIENAAVLETRVEFFKSDILTNDIPVGELDAVVSNPPYIPLSEKGTMKNNVTRFEPSLALFVPDDDPMKFYKAICDKAFGALKSEGLLAFEINERLGSDVVNVLTQSGFHNVQIVKDLFHKERIVKGLRP